MYKRFIEPSKCRIIIAHNKDNAINALTLLAVDRFSGVLTIVDADFWRLEGTSPASPSILLTDTHDLETMLLRSSAFEKVLSEFGSEEKIASLEKQRGIDIRALLLESAVPIGYLRWVSLLDNLSLKFEGLSFSDFVNRVTLITDIPKLLKSVKNHSQKHALEEKTLAGRMQKLQSNTHDPWHICCGHDLICILSIGLCKALGSSNPTDVKPDVLEKFLRVGYEYSHFGGTELYRAIRQWEAANSPYQVLP